MTSAVHVETEFDRTALAGVLRQGTLLGALQSALILAGGLAYRFLDGPAELVAVAALVVAGLAVTTALPGLWTRPRTVEGIAGAAGIGLWATVIYLVADVVALQPLGTYTNRWLDIGGGSNWWYHPIWWMVGTYLPWMGAQIFASHAARGREPSAVAMLGTAFTLALVIGAAAVVIGFPGARWGVGTFAVAFLPGVTLAAVLAALGARRA